MMTYTTISQAREMRDIRISTLTSRCPLRYRPVIVAGPDDGYCVIELGQAVEHEMEVIR